MKICQRAELYQKNQKEIFQNDEKIYRYQQNWIATRGETSIRLLEFDDNYRKFREKSNRLKIKNRNLIRDIVIDLEQDQLPYEEWQNNQDLLFSLFQCLKQNEIDIAGLCPKLLLVYKRLEEQKQRLSNHARKGIRCLKEELFFKELKIKNHQKNSEKSIREKNRNTKKIVLASLASYILGDVVSELHFANFQCPSLPLVNNNLTNPTQLKDWQGNSINYNQTHSWIENPLLEDISTQFLQSFEREVINQPKTNFDINGDIDDYLASDFTPPSPHESNLLNELAQLRLRPNITQAEYERLKANQAPTNLPLDWEKQSARLKDLEHWPTPEQLAQAVQTEKAKHQHLVDPATYRQDWINPAELETKAQAKGLVSLETYNLRPNITLTEYKDLVSNQKPTDLPNNWKNELEKIPELEKRPNITQEEFAKYKSPEQVKEIEKLIQKTVQKEFEGFINPKSPQVLKEYKLFTKDQNELQTDLTKAKAAHKKLENDLDNKAKSYNALNQTKLDLETKLLTKSAKIETLNSLLNTLKNKYGRVRSERDSYKNDLTSTQQRIQELEQEKNQALANVETFNQQLNDVQQELVRTQREKRKLAQKFQQAQDQHTKTQTEYHQQTSYLSNIFKCLASAGLGFLASPTPKTLSKKEIQILIEGLETLVKQRNSAQLVQQQAEAKRDRAQSERDQLQQQIDNHRCCNSANSNQASQNQVKTIKQDNEQEIIRELNATLYLNLNSPTLKQVITEIQSRLTKDPIITQKSFNYAFDTFQVAEKELIQQLTPFGEDLEVIKDLEIKGLGELLPDQLEEKFISQIKQVQNYQQLVEIRNSFLSKYLAKSQKEEIKETIQALPELKPLPLVNKLNTEIYIWIGLLTVALIGLGWLVVKLRKKDFVTPPPPPPAKTNGG